MALQFGIAAAGQQQEHRRAAGPPGPKLIPAAPVSIDDGVPDKLHAQSWRVPGVPFLLERKDAQQQIHVALELVHTARPRCPHLRRNVLNNFRIPVEKRPSARADILSYGARKAAVEPREIHPDDDGPLSLEREVKEMVRDRR